MCVNTPARKTCCFPGSSKTIWPLPFLPIPGSQRLDESGLPNPPCLDGSQFVYLFICYLILCVYCYCLAYIRHFWMWVVEILSVVSNQKTVVSDLLVCFFKGKSTSSNHENMSSSTSLICFFFPLVKNVKFETLLLKPDPHWGWCFPSETGKPCCSFSGGIEWTSLEAYRLIARHQGPHELLLKETFDVFSVFCISSWTCW